MGKRTLNSSILAPRPKFLQAKSLEKSKQVFLGQVKFRKVILIYIKNQTIDDIDGWK